MTDDQPNAGPGDRGNGSRPGVDPVTELKTAREELAQAKLEVARLRAAERELVSVGERERSELTLRTRNLLAVIRSLLARTAETAESAEEALDHFRGRLDAVARYQLEASRSRNGVVDVETLLREELLTVGAGDGPGIALDGTAVSLFGKAAEVFGLAVHELVTNSVKFGALDNFGRKSAIRVHWSLREGRLHFEWQESGVAILTAAPIRTGFGREWIEQALPYQLGARTTFEIVPGGVRCSIDIPAEWCAANGTAQTSRSNIDPQ